MTATAALYPEIAGEVDEFALYVAVRLRDGATVDDLQGGSIDVLSSAERTKPARRTISTLAVGLAVLAGVAGVAVLVTAAQAIARQVGGAVAEEAVMGALGMTRPQRGLALATTVLPVALATPVVALLTAFLGSSLPPIGLARRAEPTPGLRADVPVLVLGAVTTGLVIAVVAVAAAARATHPPTTTAHHRTAGERCGRSCPRRSAGPRSPGRLAGLRHPTDRAGRLSGRGRGRVRCHRGDGVDRLRRQPAPPRQLLGSLGLAVGPGPRLTSSDVDRATRALADDHGLSAVSRWDSGAAIVDGTYVRASAVTPVRGELGFSLVEGRQPGRGEAVVGPETAIRPGLEIGDSVRVAPPSDPTKEVSLRIVGLALFPEIDDGDFVDGIGMSPEDFADHAEVPDLFEASQLVVRIAPGTSLDATEARLRDRFGGALSSPRPVPPGAVGNLVGIRSIPRVLLASAALLGRAALAHTIRSTRVRRTDDFTTLRAIGMTRRQRRGCSLSQSIGSSSCSVEISLRRTSSFGSPRP